MRLAPLGELLVILGYIGQVLLFSVRSFSLFSIVGSYAFEIGNTTDPVAIGRIIEGTTYRATNPNFWGSPRQITVGMGIEW